MDRMLNSRRVETSCLVCGDKASGRHYGVPSCDGCRGFFKRSIRRNLDYICKESNQCVVDVSRRNQCQACRFRRCLEVNMKRDAVQHERAPRGALKRIYPPEFLPTTPMIASNPLNVSHLYAGSFTLPWPRPTLGNILQVPPHFLQVPPLEVAESSANRPTAAGSGSRNQVKDDEVSSSAIEDTNTTRREIVDLTEACKSAERNNAAAAKASNVPSTILNGGNAALHSNLRPSFELDQSGLAYRDQILLLEETWHELFVFTIAQWGLNLEEVAVLGNSGGGRVGGGGDERNEVLLQGLQQLRQLVAKLHLLRLDHTEYALLKALVLFKPDTVGLRDSVAIELLQDQTQMMLQEYCTQHPTFTAGIPARHSMVSSRFGKLLLLLPAFRSLRHSSVRDLFFRHLIGDIPITRLLSDVMGTF